MVVNALESADRVTPFSRFCRVAAGGILRASPVFLMACCRSATPNAGSTLFSGKDERHVPAQATDRAAQRQGRSDRHLRDNTQRRRARRAGPADGGAPGSAAGKCVGDSEERRREQVEREARNSIGLDVDARPRLRAAHQALAEARDELARRREVVEAAEAHVARCEAAAAAARQVLDGIASRATTAIVAQLEKGEAPNGPTPTRAAAEKAEAARAELAHGQAAKAEVEAAADRADRAVVAAESHLKEAAHGVIRLRVSELQAEIGELNAQLEAAKARINRLLPTLADRRWPVPWPAEGGAAARSGSRTERLTTPRG